MSLRRMKTLYCVSAISIALILAALAGGIGEIAAIILLAGALPMFNIIFKTGEQRGKNDLLRAIEHRRASYQSTTAKDPPESYPPESRPEDLSIAHQAHQKTLQ